MDRVCAIYNRISLGTESQLEEKRKELIEYCQNKLNIKKYVLFEEIASVEGERKEFKKMIDGIHNKEFTDLLVYHPNRIYRAEYNKKKFDDIIMDIVKYNVALHSIEEKNINDPLIDKYLNVLKLENKYFDKYLKNKANILYDPENLEESNIKDKIVDFMNNAVIWRKIKTKQDMYGAMNSKYKFELLRLSDYYFDELSQLFADFFNIEDYSEMEDEKLDKLFSIESYKILLDDVNTPIRIKECIELFMESDKVCKQLSCKLCNE